jgi:hypothetical protein
VICSGDDLYLDEVGAQQIARTQARAGSSVPK